MEDFESGEWEGNKHRNTTFDILLAARRFGLYSLLMGMIEGSIPIVGKRPWSKRVWEKAWHFEYVFWDSIKLIHKENDVLHSIVVHTRHMSWWRLAGEFPEHIKMCEYMAKFICHASRLKCDDGRLNVLLIVPRVNDMLISV